MANIVDEERLLTKRELCERLNMAEHTLVYLRSRGLPVVRISPHIYRYRWSDVQAWIEAPDEGN